MDSKPTGPRLRVPHCGAFEDYVDASDVVPLPHLPQEEFRRLRNSAFRRVIWSFVTTRNLWVHRGRFHHDILGFGWAALYRTLRVGAVVITTFRNEGHYRAGERIVGTGEFAKIFRYGREAPAIHDIIRIINLRHHVAGVVMPHLASDLPEDCSAWLPPGTRMAVRVIDGYEANYAAISLAFVENLRRGLEACGVSRSSPAGRRMATEMCRLMYHAAGAVGLTRIPRDLDAHDRFCAAYDAAFLAHPPSARVRRMAQEIAAKILPVTAAMTGVSMEDHLERHVDPLSREWLFPDPQKTVAELTPYYDEWKNRRRRSGREGFHHDLVALRQKLWKREDVAALWDAYDRADSSGTEARLIGAILLHVIDHPSDPLRQYRVETITTGPDAPLIVEAGLVSHMVVVLESTEPLVVLEAGLPGQEPMELAQLPAPNVFGEIAMWKGGHAVATVLCRKPATLRVIRIDPQQFESLKLDPGFRAAATASVQFRLAVDSQAVSAQLQKLAGSTTDPRLRSVGQLLAFLAGDSHSPLDAVVGVHDDATPAECLDALHEQVSVLLSDPVVSEALKQELKLVVDLMR